MKTYMEFLNEINPEYQFEYAAVVGHFSEKKEFYCRKEVNKGIRCNSQCQACVKIDSND